MRALAPATSATSRGGTPAPWRAPHTPRWPRLRSAQRAPRFQHGPSVGKDFDAVDGVAAAFGVSRTLSAMPAAVADHAAPFHWRMILS